MMYSEFLDFWNYNRMIKINTIDRIKCWHQLGNIRIFKYKDSRTEGIFEGATNAHLIKD